MADIIKIENLSKTFGNGDTKITALENINIDIKEGEIFGIIGLSGAGKSTLVRCINYLEKPTSGEVIFDGKSLSSLSKKELLTARRSMSMIFQGFNLLSQRNAIDNICFPLEIAGVPKSEAKKQARELLELVDLKDREKAYPAQMSGGQKQRVAIARALATNPKVLLCDEATSALDPTTTQSILNLLKEINKKLGVTIIVITHEMRVIEQICNRVAVIDDAHIVEMGDVKEIFLHPVSETAKKLIFPSGNAQNFGFCEKKLRLVFDGVSLTLPVISDMVLECHAAVNIVYADTKTVDDRMYGQMLIQLPNDDVSIERIKRYLNEKQIVFKEEE